MEASSCITSGHICSNAYCSFYQPDLLILFVWSWELWWKWSKREREHCSDQALYFALKWRSLNASNQHFPLHIRLLQQDSWVTITTKGIQVLDLVAVTACVTLKSKLELKRHWVQTLDVPPAHMGRKGSDHPDTGVTMWGGGHGVLFSYIGS